MAGDTVDGAGVQAGRSEGSVAQCSVQRLPCAHTPRAAGGRRASPQPGLSWEGFTWTGLSVPGARATNSLGVVALP